MNGHRSDDSQAQTRSKIEQDIPDIMEWLGDRSSIVRESVLNAFVILVQYRK
jgi:hypothetical protein